MSKDHWGPPEAQHPRNPVHSDGGPRGSLQKGPGLRHCCGVSQDLRGQGPGSGPGVCPRRLASCGGVCKEIDMERGSGSLTC